MNDNDKIAVLAEAYLNFATEGTANQIAGFLRQGTFSFKSGKPSAQRVATVLTQSYRFLSNKSKNNITIYRLAEV